LIGVPDQNPYAPEIPPPTDEEFEALEGQHH
jgi:hypothetical protein